jgi:hypothetical protein
MHDTHKPFVALVMQNTDKYDESEVVAFTEGKKKDSILAKCMELWSKGNNGRVADLLNDKCTIEELQESGELQKEKEELEATPS